MVAADSEAVAVTGHLPNAEFGMRGLDTSGDSSSTAVDSVESVGCQVVRHTA